MSDQINSHICLLSSIYKSFHKTVKYDHQRDHILKDLTVLELKVPMKASKTKNRFETGFEQPKTSLPNRSVLTSLGATKKLVVVI